MRRAHHTASIALPGLLLFTLFSPAAQAQETAPLDETAGHHIPITYAPPMQPYILVQASINGKLPLPFLIDTGDSTPLILAPWAARLLDLEGNSAKIRLNGAIDAKAVTIRRVDLLGVTPGESMRYDLQGSAVNAYVVDLSSMDEAYAGPRIAGVLGAPMLAPTTVRFDFARRQMTIFTAPHDPIKLPGAWNLPLTLKDDRYYTAITTTEGDTTEILVDTGSFGTGLPMRLSAHLKPQATRIAGTGQLDNITLSSQWLLPNLKIGPLLEPNMTATEATETGSELGMDFLARYRITFDFPNKQMTLERAANYDQAARLSGWTGAMVQIHSGRVMVRKVLPGSPAGLAGLRTNDEILEVDDTKMTGLTANVAQRLLDGAAGTTATLSVRSLGDVRKLTLTRKTEFDRPASLFDGVMLYRQLKQPLTLLDIAPDSLAAMAGLKRNDQILEIQGIDVKRIIGPDLLETLRSHTLTLQVRHPGEKASRMLTLTLPD